MKIRYNNSEYPITSSDIIYDIATKEMLRIVTKKIQPFESEATQLGGEIIIEVVEPLKIRVIAKDLPDDLIRRIQEAGNSK